jgi:hypothetical protein
MTDPSAANAFFDADDDNNNEPLFFSNSQQHPGYAPLTAPERTFEVEESTFVARPHKRSRQSSVPEDVFAAHFDGLFAETPTTATDVLASSSDLRDSTLDLPPLTPSLTLPSSMIDSTTTLVSSVTSSTPPAVPTTTTTAGAAERSVESFEVAVPFDDNAVCRAILPLFHAVELEPDDFAVRLRLAAASPLQMKGRDGKLQDMRDLIIQLYKTRFQCKNAPDDSYYATTQCFFYPSVIVWRALGNPTPAIAKAFLDCETHIVCAFCGHDTAFKLRNNCGQYLDPIVKDPKMRPHRHDAMHHFLKRILAEKLWCWQRFPVSFN